MVQFIFFCNRVIYIYFWGRGEKKMEDRTPPAKRRRGDDSKRVGFRTPGASNAGGGAGGGADVNTPPVASANDGGGGWSCTNCGMYFKQMSTLKEQVNLLLASNEKKRQTIESWKRRVNHLEQSRREQAARISDLEQQLAAAVAATRPVPAPRSVAPTRPVPPTPAHQWFGR